MRPQSRLGMGAVAMAAALLPAAASPAPRGIGTLARPMSPRITRCVIAREPELVRSWLETLPGSSAEDRLVRRAEPRFVTCFGDLHGGMGIAYLPAYDRVAMRSALVRALLQERRDRLPELLPPGTGLPAAASAPGAEAGGADGAALAAAELGACLARKHWPNVVGLIRAVDAATEKLDFVVTPRWNAAHEREEAAVKAELAGIIPSVAGCVPAGTRLRIDRRRLRSLVEEAAYHLLAPARAGSLAMQESRIPT